MSDPKDHRTSGYAMVAVIAFPPLARRLAGARVGAVPEAPARASAGGTGAALRDAGDCGHHGGQSRREDSHDARSL